MTDREGTRCPECVAEGERSRVYEPAAWFTTAMMGQRYYDEDGRYHVHDPNTRSGEWSCSRGHRWKETLRSHCPQGDWRESNDR